APLGPRKPSTSPGWTWNDRSSTAVCCAKRLVRFLISIMASHRREGHCAQRNHRTRAGRKNAEHATTGSDEGKTVAKLKSSVSIPKQVVNGICGQRSRGLNTASPPRLSTWV